MAAETAKLIVTIVEDQRDIREGLQMLINGTAGFKCADTFRTVEQALAHSPSAGEPDIILMDIGLPGMSGIEGIPLMRQRHPKTHILVLTVFDDDDRIFRALCAGAAGYLLKRTAPARLLENLREAANNGSPISPEIARRVISLFQRFQPVAQEDCALTSHEIRLLGLLAEGHSCKSAGAKLGTSINTIAFHMKNIYSKLHVHSKSEAVAKALRTGILH